MSRWGGRVDEVPITFTDRVRGTSKMSFSVMMEEMILMSWWGIRDRIQRAPRQRPSRRTSDRPGSWGFVVPAGHGCPPGGG